MAVSFRYAVHTDLGTVRTNNEDSALGSPRLLLLADGMGGHAAGEVASAVALRVFAELDHTPGADIGTEVAHAGRAARRALQEMSDADPMLESMGTTLVAVVSDGAHISVGHIGDSRVYALRDGALYQVTTDHTHVQRLIEQGQLTHERARTHPYRSMLLRSLDDQPGGADLDLIALDVAIGDRLLLCSDGLSDYLSPDHIRELLATPDREQAAHRLIDAALAIGTRDNVTVIVADVVEDDDGDTHALLERPVFAGAVADGVTLSPDAANALHLALPEILLDPANPSAGALLTTPHPDAAHPGEDMSSSELLDAPGPAGSHEGATPVDGTGSDVAGPAGRPGEGEPLARGRSAHDDPHGEVGTAGASRPSQLPGALAWVVVALIAVALALVLG